MEADHYENFPGAGAFPPKVWRPLLSMGAQYKLPLALRLPRRAGYDVFRHRPVLDGFDWFVVTARASLAMWLSRRVTVRHFD